MKIPQTKVIVKCISASEHTNNLPRENLETEKSHAGDTSHNCDRLFEGILYTVVILCAIIVAQDWLGVLGNAKNNCVEYGTDLRDDPHTGKGDIPSIW